MAKPGQKHKDLPRPPVDNGRNDSRRPVTCRSHYRHSGGCVCNSGDENVAALRRAKMSDEG